MLLDAFQKVAELVFSSDIHRLLAAGREAMGCAGWTGPNRHSRAQVGLPLALVRLDDRAWIATPLQAEGLSVGDACAFQACASSSVPLVHLLAHTSDFSASPPA